MTLVLITNEYTASESLIMGVSNYHAYECFIVERWKVHLGCWIFVGQLFASLFVFLIGYSQVGLWPKRVWVEFWRKFGDKGDGKVLNTFTTFSLHHNSSQGTEKAHTSRSKLRKSWINNKQMSLVQMMCLLEEEHLNNWEDISMRICKGTKTVTEVGKWEIKQLQESVLFHSHIPNLTQALILKTACALTAALVGTGTLGRDTLQVCSTGWDVSKGLGLGQVH